MAIGLKTLGNSQGKITPLGGYAIQMTNNTGGASKKGYIVEAESNSDNGVAYTQADDIDPIGIMLEEGIPDGDLVWVVVSGIAEVYYSGNVTRATFSRVSITSEALQPGIAVNEALPSPPFSTDKHFQEIGHPIENRTGAGLAKTVLHFN
jgi:hypothetical protein